jgi:L-fucose mutarotase
MIHGSIIHPEILAALAAAGHGSQVVITDSNYPHSTGTHPDAMRVFLNFAPGKLTVTDVLEGLVKTIPIEAAHGIAPDTGAEPKIFDEYRKILPGGVPLEKLGRFPFYDAARKPDTALLIATGEQRTWACLILTIGVIESDIEN